MSAEKKTAASKSSLEDRYYDLLRIQRRVNKVIDAHVEDSAEDLETAKSTLAREVEKLVRLDTEPAIFKAIARAAWEAPDSADFARLAKETEAKVRLKYLTSRYGAPQAFIRAISKEKESLEGKEVRLDELRETTERLTKQLAMIQDHNNGYANGERNMSINEGNRQEIEGAGFFSGTTRATNAKSVVKAYGKKYGTGRSDYFTPANCFADMKELEDAKRELKGLEPDIEFSRDKHFQRLSAFKEVRDIQQTLKECGVAEDSPINLEEFKGELCKRLNDDSFIGCFARETPSGVGGSIILAALTARVRQKIQDDLEGYQNNVRAMTGHLEGPIGIIARNAGQERSIDGIERDIKSQAIMGGYLCESAAAALKAVDTFAPEHTEGPVSLTRDIQMHMLINGKVDPAYIQEVTGLDKLLTKHFNVNARRPQPDFERVLSEPASVERVDRDFASYLRENANDERAAADGFAAGQFSTDSIELFLLKRYFKASVTPEDVISALEEEANDITDVRNEREAMGIQPDGPQLPKNA